MAYLSFIIESYEGLATLSTIDAARGSARLTYLSHFAKEISGLLHALQLEGTISSFNADESLHQPLNRDDGIEAHAGKI